MGGTLGNIFRGSGAVNMGAAPTAPNDVPLFGNPPASKPNPWLGKLNNNLNDLRQRTGAGLLQNAITPRPQPPFQPSGPVPGPAPVDPSFFAPSPFSGAINQGPYSLGSIYGR